MLPRKNLLIFNYCMDLEDPLLSHQVEAVNELSKYFKRVTVITGRIGLQEVSENVRIFSSNWEAGCPIKSSVRFILLAFSFIRHNRNIVVFSHMTEVQSALLAIPLRILRIPHYLWYAHSYKSIFLIMTHYFANGIITSTKGSCPIQSNRVFPVGQAINIENFNSSHKKIDGINNLVHIGRFDQSKNIVEIINTIKEIRIRKNLLLDFTQIGSPTTSLARTYFEQTSQEFAQEIEEGWIKFQSSILRSKVPQTLTRYDAFLHAYNGSLDKSIVEATLVGIPVITTNPEYLAVFGSWSKQGLVSVTLGRELEALANLQINDVTEEIENRRRIATQGHSLKNWGLSISRILSRIDA
jgi:glycosyltransferase involved in cell wall biosynthesis